MIMDDTSLAKVVRIIIEAIDPDSIILFGSRAKDSHNNESDYDICVLKTGLKERRKTAKMLYRSLYGVGVPVDILVETPDSFNTHKNNPHLIYREIAQFGKVLYEKPTNC
jgi:predicted nucleotidyltransferase